MFKTKLATLFAVGTLFVSGIASSAYAASPMSAAFLANVRPNVDFLDSSSRLALTHSSNQRIRIFARSEATEQTITSNSLVAYASQNGFIVGQTLYDANSGGPLSPVVGVATLPLGVAAGLGDGLLSGRSVAIDNPLAPRNLVPVQPMLASGTDDLARLQGLSGRSFDALYRSTQTDALRQLATLYGDYLQNGDDVSLRAIAGRELPKINSRLRELNAL